jgi:uncharacterized protein YeaO (DUF488 family)
MTISIVRLGSPRLSDEGLRIGTVRFPPRGVPKAARATADWFDIWYPNLAPQAATLKISRAADDPRAWSRFVRLYRREMASPENQRSLDLLAALSHTTNLSVGCYCVDEARCHRSILRELLHLRGARLSP